MLTIFIFQLYISVISIASGCLFYTFLGKPFFSAPKLLPCFVTGLILIAGISQMVSLFAPVNFYLSLLCLIPVAVAFLFRPFRAGIGTIFSALRQTPLLHLLLYTAVYLLLLLITAGPVIMDDTESYHLQMVRWLQQYGTVPGLAHLHLRYGFHSIWFNAIAAFTPGGGANFYTALNGLLSTAMAFYLLQQGLPLFKTAPVNKALSFGCLCLLTLLLVFWPFLRGAAANTNYDYITALCTVFLFIECVGKGSPGHTEELLLWPVFLCTVRILHFPTLVLSIYALYILIRRKNIKRAVVLCGVCLAIAIPFFARNILLSGYPLYPAMIGKWTTYDWEVHRESITGIRHYIKYFNRVNNMFLPISETEKLRFPAWIPVWARYLFTYDKLLLLCSGGGFAWALSRKKVFTGTIRICFAFFFCLQLIVWFWVAPDPRFIHGIFFCGVLTAGMALYGLVQLLPLKTQVLAPSLLPVGCGLFCCFLFLKKLKTEPDYQNAFGPYQLPRPPVSVLKIDGQAFYIPQKIKGNWNARCYALPLPCVYDSLPGVHLRTKALKDGFYNHNPILYVP